MSDRHTPDFTQYVLGFRFSDSCREIVLIRKNRPKWQAGMWNVPGGHVEKDETPMLAMVREFQEEAGLVTTPVQWDHFVTLAGKDYDLHCFRSFGPLDGVETKTEEKVIVAPMPINEAIIRVVHNLHWLVPMALDESVVGDYHSANVVNVQ